MPEISLGSVLLMHDFCDPGTSASASIDVGVTDGTPVAAFLKIELPFPGVLPKTTDTRALSDLKI